MSQFSAEELERLLRVNSKIAAENYMRFQDFCSDSPSALAALLAYTGIVYKRIHPQDFTPEDFQYAQDHLRITSFLYGLLRPLDQIKNYRMEGDIKLPERGGISMFDYWKPILTDTFIKEIKARGGILINLASGEMKDLFDWKRVEQEVQVITPEFQVWKKGKLTTVVVYAKMCRGELTQRGFKPAPDVDAIMALTSSQMDAINTALAQQIEQNRQLKAQLANQPTEVVTEQVTVNQIAPAPQSVFFQIGSAVLPTNSTVNLQQIADLVKDNPGLKLKVTGYADSDTGSAAWNKQLSEDRANNVANELVKLGVNKNNLIISGMGGVNTLTPPAFNRRVIIEAQ
jgi:uncharacterized protein